MKIAESWLREWVSPDVDTAALGHQLTMLGHEVDSIELIGGHLSEVVIAEVNSVEKHPDADKLSLCKVDDGSGDLVDVVCGAPNVHKGMKTPFARPGVTLPNGMQLRKAKIRGIVSNGMLCSAVELGLGDESDGIMSLPQDAVAGAALTTYLNLPDAVIDLDLTPNRGDCFSVLGIARDIAAQSGAALKSAVIDNVAATIDDRQEVELVDPQGCPRFAGRVIRGIDPGATSPIWMIERLRRSGLRAISPVVDITNYVMLELGQPLHAYDHRRLQGVIRPRMATTGESLVLLDEKEIQLNADTMIITDDSGPIGIAGIMGGLSTAVTNETVDVFFEAAFWPQDVIAGRARGYGMHTDASMRFERGVDPAGQTRAIDRASRLLLDISGGSAGPLVDISVAETLPVPTEITLRRSRIAQLLGLSIDDSKVEAILSGLGMSISTVDNGWKVTPPSYRFDAAIEPDLIEEIARIHGYDSIPEATAVAQAALETVSESKVESVQVSTSLIARDYQEVITYSFIDSHSNRTFSGTDSALVLSNPISSEMSVMRATLWPGMVSAAAANTARQQDRVRLFEISKSFHGTLEQHTEVLRIAGLATGSRYPEQWATDDESIDFFDIKSDVEAVLALADRHGDFDFRACEHAALQQGQCAEILRDDEVIGVMGKLHPSIAKQYALKKAVYLFELDADKTLASKAPTAAIISKFPALRRDIAVVVDENISASRLLNTVRTASPELIRDVRIFDIYTGDRIEAGRKSVAIGLILQETSRTLTDDDADRTMAAVIKKLEDQFAAELRD